MTQTTNAAGITIIKHYEGLVLTAAPDPGGVLTIGYGHTVGVYPGEVITQAQADQLLAQDLLTFETGVGSVANAPGANEFSAMVSLAYNIGIAAFKTSTVLRDHNAGNKQGAAAAFLLWDKAHVNGQLVELAGLVARRKAESGLYLTVDAPPTPVPEDTVLDTVIAADGTTHQTIRRILVASATTTTALVVAALLALPVMGCLKRSDPIKIQVAHPFDWSGTTFYFDKSLNPVNRR